MNQISCSWGLFKLRKRRKIGFGLQFTCTKKLVKNSRNPISFDMLTRAMYWDAESRGSFSVGVEQRHDTRQTDLDEQSCRNSTAYTKFGKSPRSSTVSTGLPTLVQVQGYISLTDSRGQQSFSDPQSNPSSHSLSIREEILTNIHKQPSKSGGLSNRRERIKSRQGCW